VTILAAASTRDALSEIIAHPQLSAMDIRVSYGGTNQLAMQILEGAPADVFLSASDSWMKHVEDAGVVAQVEPLLTNRLVIIVPSGNDADIYVPDDLVRVGVTRIALAGENVPAGQYAEQALRALNVHDSLSATGRIVRGNDVRAVLNVVARGEVDAGIVYETDAAVSAGVEIVHRFDTSLHAPIVYTVALLASATSNEAALAVWAHLRSPAAETVWTRHGFARIR
jgi:molybdate transport system substrate-binding protein